MRCRGVRRGFICTYSMHGCLRDIGMGERERRLGREPRSTRGLLNCKVLRSASPHPHRHDPDMISSRSLSNFTTPRSRCFLSAMVPVWQKFNEHEELDP